MPAGLLRLDELLGEVQERLAEIVHKRDRLQQLLDAVLVIAAGLEIDTTLRRIVQAAVDLADARYGALAVLAPDGSIAQFLHVGLDEEVAAEMGPLPEGKGLLGQLVMDPRPLRLADLTQHEASAGFPPNHPPMRTFLGVPIRVDDALFGNLYLTEKNDGAEFTDDDEVVVEALAAAAGVAVQNADLFEHIRLREQWLQTSAEIRAEMLSGASDEDALRLIAQRTLELSGSDATLVVLGPDPVHGRFGVVAHCGQGEPCLVGRSLDGTDPLLREAVDGRTPVLATSAGSLLSTACRGGGPSEHGGEPAGGDLAGGDLAAGDLAAGDQAGGPTVTVPLLSQDRVTGLLIAVRRAGKPAFQPAEVPLLTSFAEQVTLARELGKKNRAQRQLDVFADRDRIARDLHDHVIQRLFATGLQLQSTLRRCTDPGVQKRIQQAVEELDTTVREIRTAIFDLHTTGDAAGPGLRRRLLNTAADAAESSPLSPSIRIDGAVETLVPPAIGAHAVAVVREAVSNAVRHAGASAVTVTIEAGDELVVEVVDDGVGIPPGTARSGLRNLEQRARDCGGELVVSSLQGVGGTRLSWRVPLP